MTHVRDDVLIYKYYKIVNFCYLCRKTNKKKGIWIRDFSKNIGIIDTMMAKCWALRDDLNIAHWIECL